ncbi:MAG: DUF4159 domain-containing protein [Phycisphaerae bacterium]
MIGLLAAGAAAQSKPAEPTTRPATDRRVSSAVGKAVDALLAAVGADGSFTEGDSAHQGGTTSLVILAALQAGEKADSPRLAKSLAYIQTVSPTTVYARSVRTLVYAKLPQKEYGKRLQADVDWLVRNQSPLGGWGFGPGHSTTIVRPRWTDMWNTQYAAMALDRASRAGASVPARTWERLRTYWLNAQNDDGGWGYTPPQARPARLRGSSYGSMTAAGVDVSCLLLDYAVRNGRAAETVTPIEKSISAGNDWLQKHAAADKHPQYVWGSDQERYHFYLWCLARAAERCGTASFGKLDWCPAITAHLLRTRHKTGLWGPRNDQPGPENILQTSFAVLALTRASGPVLMYYLGFDDRGPCRPAAVHFTRAASDALEQDVTWEHVRANQTWQEIARSPILLLDGRKKLAVDEALSIKLKQAAGRGAVLVVQAPLGNEELYTQLRGYFTKLLPGTRAVDLAEGHPLLSVSSRCQPLKGFTVDAPGRIRVVVLAEDFLGDLRTGRSEQSANSFAFAENLAVYATGPLGLRGRLAARKFVTPEPTTRPKPKRFFTITRVKHPGAWNEAPKAVDRISDALALGISIGVKETAPTDLSEVPAGTRLLWITGTRKLSLDKTQLKNLAAFVRGGGTIFVDSAYGAADFADSARKLLSETFGTDPQKLPAAHPIITGRLAGGVGCDVTAAEFTPNVSTKPAAPPLEVWMVGKRPAVIFSLLGVTGPAESQPYGKARALTSADAKRLAINVLLYEQAARRSGRKRAKTKDAR